MLAVLSAGSNAHGQLGNASLDDSQAFQRCSFTNQPPHKLPIESSHVVGLATGANHTLLLLEMEDKSRVLWGSGDGRKGQLGLKYQQDILNGRPQTLFQKIELSLEDSGLGGYSYKSIAATWETSYVVLSCEGKGDIVISLGSDDYGDLGVDGLKGKQPQKDFHVVRFDHVLPSEAPKVLTISSGQRHVIAHLQSGSSSVLVGWGTSRHGQLGLPTDTPFLPLPRIVSNEEQIMCCALGIHHTVVLHDSDRLWGLGSDRKGQLQVVKTFAAKSLAVQSVGCTWNGTYLVTEGEEGWEVHSSGSNSHSQLGRTDSASVGIVKFPEDIDSRNTSVAIACGSEHVLALVTPQSGIPHVWGWGWNEHGNLGLGHTEDVPAPVELWPNEVDIVDIRGIWAGSGTSWICAEVAE